MTGLPGVRTLRALFTSDQRLPAGNQAHETHVSTQQAQTQTRTWFPGTHGHSRRPPDSQASPRERAGTALSLGRQPRRRVSAVIRTAISPARRCSPARAVAQNDSIIPIDALLIDAPVFPRRNRLTEAADFDRVFKSARRSRDGHFTVLYHTNDLGYPRLGLAIAKKRVRRAVDRNRLKRIVRESFRLAKKQLTGVDIVIMAGGRAVAARNAEIFASLEEHWRAVARATDTRVNESRANKT